MPIARSVAIFILFQSILCYRYLVVLSEVWKRQTKACACLTVLTRKWITFVDSIGNQTNKSSQPVCLKRSVFGKEILQVENDSSIFIPKKYFLMYANAKKILFYALDRDMSRTESYFISPQLLDPECFVRPLRQSISTASGNADHWFAKSVIPNSECNGVAAKSI